MPGIVQVDPHDVIIHGVPFRRDIDYQKTLLEKQGQIEPLVAQLRATGWHVDNSDWPYATAQVVAARELDWPTILVTDE